MYLVNLIYVDSGVSPYCVLIDQRGVGNSLLLESQAILSLSKYI